MSQEITVLARALGKPYRFPMGMERARVNVKLYGMETPTVVECSVWGKDFAKIRRGNRLEITGIQHNHIIKATEVQRRWKK